jgi:hypothetical protein
MKTLAEIIEAAAQLEEDIESADGSTVDAVDAKAVDELMRALTKFNNFFAGEEGVPWEGAR